MLLVPLAKAGRFVHFLDDLAPADTRIVCTERNLAFLRPIWDHAHFGAAKIVIKEVLEPHSLYTEDAPFVRIIVLRLDFHAVVAVRIRIRGRWFEQVEYLRDWKALGRLAGVIIA